MIVNTYQRSRTISNRRIVKTAKEIYEEGMKKQFPDEKRPVKTEKKHKPITTKLKTNWEDYL